LIAELKIKPEVDTVIYVPGAILWVIDKRDIRKSGLQKLL